MGKVTEKSIEKALAEKRVNKKSWTQWEDRFPQDAPNKDFFAEAAQGRALYQQVFGVDPNRAL